MQMLKRMIAMIVAIVMAVGPVLSHAAPAAESVTAPTDAEILKRLDRFDSLIRSLGQHIDRSQFDLDALLEKLDFDAQPIIKFVKTQIAFEQYPGLLRGAQGTLMSRAGNSLDQAVLLATLLGQAGLDVRIARNKLSHDQALKVLEEMARPRSPQPPIGDTKAIEAVFVELGWLKDGVAPVNKVLHDYVSGAMNLATTDAFKAAQIQADGLRELFASVDSDLSESSVENPLIAEAVDYYWVQYRESAAQAFEPAHPVFAGEPAFELELPEQILNESIPTELQFRLGIEVVLEVAQSGVLTEKTLIEPKMLPTANLAVQPITFSNLPDSLFNKGFESIGDLEKLVDQGSYIAPVLEGTDQRGMMFDLAGNLIDPMVAGGSGTDMFATINKAFRDVIANIGNKAALPVVTSQAIKIHIARPGGELRTITRRTFDLLGEAVRATGKVKAFAEPSGFKDVRSLFQRHSLMTSTGGMPAAYVMFAGVEHMANAYGAVRATLPGASASHLAKSEESKRRPPGHWGGHPALFKAFGHAQDLSSQHRIYRPAPAVVIHTAGLKQGSGSVAMVDVASNPTRAIDVSAGSPVPDKEMAMRVGVWETFAEGLGLQGPGPRQNTMTALAKSAQQNIPIQVINSEARLNELGLRAETVAVARQDLEAGYSLVIPAREFSASSDTGWWRVNVDNGQTLGMLGNGRGVEMLEELILSTISFAAFNYGISRCMGTYTDEGRNDIRFLCCMAFNVAFLVAGIFIGAALTPVKDLAGGTVGSQISVIWNLIGLKVNFCG